MTDAKPHNRYKVAIPIVVHTADGAYEQGDEFENDFSIEDERENVQSGLLEILPTTWKVIGTSRVHETDPGDTFEAVLTLGQQELLLEGGHIEPVVEKKSKGKAKAEPQPEEGSEG